MTMSQTNGDKVPTQMFPSLPKFHGFMQLCRFEGTEKLHNVALSQWASTAKAVNPLTGVGVVIIVYLLSLFLRELRDPARKVLGPFAARFSKLWYSHRLYRGDFHLLNAALHRKHGKIVRIAPDWYSIDDPDAAKILYGPGTQFVKGEWYTVWGPPEIAHINLFAQQDPKLHAAARRKYANFYAMSSLVQYEDYINEVVDLFCHKLDGLALEKKTIDFTHWLQCYAFDVIAKITFGNRMGFLDNGDDIGGIMGGLESLSIFGCLLGLFPWIYRWLFSLKLPAANDPISSFTNASLDRRQKAIEEGKPVTEAPEFCARFADAHEKDPENFTKLHVVGGATANIGAGSDTTTIALASIMYNLIHHPSVLKRLRDEFRGAEISGKISRPATFAQVQRLEYFQAVVKEAMRLHPSTALPFWRIVPQGGATIAGQYFRPGTTVGINSWVAHRNRDVFGSDADSFRPERWLEAYPEHASAMDRYWMPFGLGARTCIGKNISLLEISKVIPVLIRRYDFEQIDEDKMVSVNWWFIKQKGFKVLVKLRGEDAF